MLYIMITVQYAEKLIVLLEAETNYPLFNTSYVLALPAKYKVMGFDMHNRCHSHVVGCVECGSYQCTCTRRIIIVATLSVLSLYSQFPIHKASLPSSISP